MSKIDSRKILGDLGEGLAESWLEDQGYISLYRNFRIRSGQMDLIMQDPDGSLAFVEVKTRRAPYRLAPKKFRDEVGVPNLYYDPNIKISSSQIKALKRTARNYLRDKNIVDRDWRVDLIYITIDLKNLESVNAKIRHYRNIMES